MLLHPKRFSKATIFACFCTSLSGTLREFIFFLHARVRISGRTTSRSWQFWLSLCRQPRFLWWYLNLFYDRRPYWRFLDRSLHIYHSSYNQLWLFFQTVPVTSGRLICYNPSLWHYRSLHESVSISQYNLSFHPIKKRYLVILKKYATAEKPHNGLTQRLCVDSKTFPSWAAFKKKICVMYQPPKDKGCP